MIDFTQFRLIDWFEESSMKDWARTTLPGIPCPALSCSDRSQRTNALEWKESRLIRLLDETNLLLREITQESAILSPVRLLPVSLVVPILKDCLTLPNLNPTTDWQNGPISSISSFWRSEVMNNASCWSSINFTFYEDLADEGIRFALESYLQSKDKMFQLKRQLKMSQAVPTYINVGYNGSTPIPRLEDIAKIFASKLQNCISFREFFERDLTPVDDEPPSLLVMIYHQDKSVFHSLRYLEICGYVENSMTFPSLHSLRVVLEFPSLLAYFNCPVMEVLLVELTVEESSREILSMFDSISQFPNLRRFRLLVDLYDNNSEALDWDLSGPESGPGWEKSLKALTDNPIRSNHLTEFVLAGPAFRKVETCFYLKHFVKMCSSLTELTLGDTDFMRIIALTPIAMQHTVTTLRFLRPPGQERYLSNEALVYQFLSVFPNLERISMCRSREEAVDDRNSYRKSQELPKHPPDCTNLIRGILGHHSGSANTSMRGFDIAGWSLDVELLVRFEEEAARVGMALPPMRFTTEAAKFSHSNVSDSEDREMQRQDLLLPDITRLGFHEACAIWRTWLKDVGRSGSHLN